MLLLGIRINRPDESMEQKKKIQPTISRKEPTDVPVKYLDCSLKGYQFVMMTTGNIKMKFCLCKSLRESQQ